LGALALDLALLERALRPERLAGAPCHDALCRDAD
jgi:hypothetical protein